MLTQEAEERKIGDGVVDGDGLGVDALGEDEEVAVAGPGVVEAAPGSTLLDPLRCVVIASCSCWLPHGVRRDPPASEGGGSRVFLVEKNRGKGKRSKWRRREGREEYGLGLGREARPGLVL